MLYFFVFNSAMIQISVVVISFNESLQIGRCLDSVKELADEIIVVDSYSTDDTVQIAQSKGAVVFQHPLKAIFNKKLCTYESSFWFYFITWCGWSPGWKFKEIYLLVKSNWNRDGYYCNRFNNYCGYWVKYCGWYPDRKMRLFNRTKGQWTGMNPHDRYELIEGSNDTEVLHGNILHYSYSSVAQHIKQMKYFSKIACTEMYSSHKNMPGFTWSLTQSFTL